MLLLLLLLPIIVDVEEPNVEGCLDMGAVVDVERGCILGGGFDDPPAEALMFKYLLVVGVNGVVKL